MKFRVGVTLLILFMLLLIYNTAFAGEIVVAIIDTGVDSQHPDLRDQLWTNPGETGVDSFGRDKSNNQVDDDGNGYIDDVHGWNFVEVGPEPTDKHGHGTHIAGIIQSIAPRAKLMILKYYDPKADEPTSITHTVHAIEYAIKMKANIINYSAGGPTSNPRERRAIERARENGILFVAAAGNESSNSDLRHYFPADYGLRNILSVTAVDSAKRLLPTSNFGLATVQVAAPGHQIRSTMPGGRYGEMTGTSQATAYASGVAARLLEESRFKGDPEGLIHQLVASGEFAAALTGKTKSRTVVNASRALSVQASGYSAGGIRPANSAAIDPRWFSPDYEVNSDFRSFTQIVEPTSR